MRTKAVKCPDSILQQMDAAPVIHNHIIEYRTVIERQPENNLIGAKVCFRPEADENIRRRFQYPEGQEYLTISEVRYYGLAHIRGIKNKAPDINVRFLEYSHLRQFTMSLHWLDLYREGIENE